MFKNITWIIWAMVVVIIALGLAALYSASYQNIRVPHSIFFDQLICAVVGLVILFLLSNFDYRRFYDISGFFYIFSFLLLVAVLFLGRDILGAKRWIEFGGLNFQPSEIAKMALILILARYFSQLRFTNASTSSNPPQAIIQGLLIPFLITLVPMMLIFKQPDLGTAILLFGIFLFMLFASGIRYGYFFGFVGVCLAAAPFFWHFLKSYQKDRLLVFLNPNIDPLGAGYTIIQSKIAIGSGRLFGKGWLAGTQNQLNFLPERHTDFIFSVIGEEWGLAGGLLLVSCYFVLIYCCLTVAQQTKDKFGSFAAVGIVVILLLQTIINIGMSLGLYPVVGLTLPLVSYGRSSFIVFIFMLGFVLNLAKRRTV